VIDTLSVPEEPSGQRPPMFSSNHQSLFKNESFQWRGQSYPNDQGTLGEWWKATFRDDIPMKRFMGSLLEYEPEYPRYSEEDRHLMLTVHPLFVS